MTPESQMWGSPNYPTRRFLGDIWDLVRPYQGRFVLASLLRFSSDLVNLYPAYALAAIVTFFSTYKTGTALTPVWHILVLLGLALLWRSVAQEFVAKNAGYQVAERVALDAQLKTLRHLFALDLVWHERENSGNRMKRVQRGGEGLNKILRMWIDRFIEITVQLVGVTIILAKFDPFIAGLTLVFSLTFFLLSFSLTRQTSLAAYVANVQEEHVSGLSFEAVNNIRTVKVLGLMRTLSELLAEAMADLFQKIKRRIFWFRLRSNVLNFWGHGFRVGMMAFLVVGIATGRYQVGFLVLFHVYFMRMWESVSELADSTHEFVIAKYGIARMQDILTEPLGIDDEKGKVPFPEGWRTIRVRNVSFRYEDTTALRNVSFDIRRGERIGVVGLSGSGKSTLLKLMLKEVEDYAGGIFFDDIPLRNISRSSYFAHVAAVLQETELFNVSLKDNITIVNRDQAQDEMRLREAVEVAHVEDFLHKLPRGIATVIGEKGIKLSGGEKQRVGIARAVYRRPQILFLDEATSHLDMESEGKIQDSLHRFFQSVTAVVIAHRLTTIKEMDRILVIEDGELLESGTFDELYKKRGRFFAFWEKQRL